MDVAIVGGHGQIALHLSRILSGRGDRVRGVIRSEHQRSDLEAVGAESIVLDIETADPGALADAVQGADAVVFAAGAGPGSGAARKETVDYEGAVKLRDAAVRAGIKRYVMVSSISADDPPQGDEVFAVYLRAKARADKAVMASELEWTIVRPGVLTNEPPTGAVTLAQHVASAKISRSDVAAVLAAVLAESRSAGHVFEVVGGSSPIADALESVVVVNNNDDSATGRSN